MKLKYADITPEAIYLDRRAFMVGAAALLVGGARAEAATPPEPAALKATPNPKFRIDDPPTKYESATTYTTSTSSAPTRATPHTTPPVCGHDRGRWSWMVSSPSRSAWTSTRC